MIMADSAPVHAPNGPIVRGDLRDLLAAERTLLAWIRTGLALMGFGFVVARFGLYLQQLLLAQHVSALQPSGLSLWFGTARDGVEKPVGGVGAVDRDRRVDFGKVVVDARGPLDSEAHADFRFGAAAGRMRGRRDSARRRPSRRMACQSASVIGWAGSFMARMSERSNSSWADLTLRRASRMNSLAVPK
jgi:hypothetical protein